MECCIAYLCSLFSEVVHYRKNVKQRKPKASIKGVCHRFSKSVSVDGQKNADKTGPCTLIRVTRATSRENVSLEIFDEVRFKPACSATEAS